MMGPNSAPNGDRGLVKGYPGEDFVWVEARKVWVSRRDLPNARTGKTEKKK